METIISIRNLVNRFGKQVVHDGLSLDVRRDEILGIVGGSGSGKSVLMRSILGLQKPNQGIITVLGQKIEYHQQARVVVGVSCSRAGHCFPV